MPPPPSNTLQQTIHERLQKKFVLPDWPDELLPELIQSYIKSQEELILPDIEPNAIIYLIPLPKAKEVCIRSIIRKFIVHSTHVCRDDELSLKQYTIVAEWLGDMFNYWLFRYIMWETEYGQFYELQERFGLETTRTVLNMGDYYNKVSKLTEERKSDKKLEPIDVYGAEHLIRLFTHLTYILKIEMENNISEERIVTAACVIDDFLEWLSKTKGYFEYCEDTTEESKELLFVEEREWNYNSDTDYDVVDNE